MRQEKTEPMGCESHSWVSVNTLEWYGATIRHYNQPREVARFCGDRCRFPLCLAKVVRKDETESARPALPPRDGATQERAFTRSLFDRLDGEEEVVEK